MLALFDGIATGLHVLTHELDFEMEIYVASEVGPCCVKIYFFTDLSPLIVGAVLKSRISILIPIDKKEDHNQNKQELYRSIDAQIGFGFCN